MCVCAGVVVGGLGLVMGRVVGEAIARAELFCVGCCVRVSRGVMFWLFKFRGV